MQIVKILFLSATLFNYSQNCNQESVISFQQNLNQHYNNNEKSPLKAKDLEVFKALDFFEIDLNYCVKATLVLTPNEQPFEMQTTTDRKPLYIKHGILHFIINEKSFQLEAYRQLSQNKSIINHKLFVPFTDLTSGNESYSGGRYLDIDNPQGEEDLIINFNNCYNPYCAYNKKYSCPIPPTANDLKIEIRAGAKKIKE